MKIAELQKAGYVLRCGFISTVRKERRIVLILKRRDDTNGTKFISSTTCTDDNTLERAEFTEPTEAVAITGVLQ